LAVFACLTTPPTRAGGVMTCDSAGAEGQGLFACTSAWSYRAVSQVTADTLVLYCRQEQAPGPQNMANCAYANDTSWIRRSTLTAAQLIGYCAQDVYSPWEVCDYPSGKEGWVRASDVLTISNPTLPPTPPPDTSTSSVTISWSPVSRNTDGTTATPSSYRIEYGQLNFATIANTTASSITFTGLAKGTWQFRIIAVSSGGSSVPSQPVSRVIS
jgi:hypothetical protein